MADSPFARGGTNAYDVRVAFPEPRPAMKAYLITTGTVFTLVTAAHVWRAIAESTALARDPWFILLTVFAAALSVWAWRLLRVATRS